MTFRNLRNFRDKYFMKDTWINTNTNSARMNSTCYLKRVFRARRETNRNNQGKLMKTKATRVERRRQAGTKADKPIQMEAGSDKWRQKEARL